jgi:hypothetical protein
MVGGAAYYAGRKVAQGNQREAEQQQRLEALEAQQQYSPYGYGQAPQYAQPPPPAQHAPPQTAGPSVTQQLTELKQLLDADVLTQAEFDEQKTKILRS